MINTIKAEWLKERHSSNRSLFWIIPLVFTIFCFLVSMLMGKAESGSISFFIAAAYNWYPSMISPIVLSLITSHAIKREDDQRKIDFQLSMNADAKSIWIAKIFITLLDYSIVTLFNLILAVIIEVTVFQETTSIGAIIFASIILIISNSWLIPFSLLIAYKLNRLMCFAINVPMTIVGVAFFAAAPAWIYFPWSYSTRMMAPVLGIHPNGTFLAVDSSLMDLSVVVLGIITSFALFILLSVTTTSLFVRSVKI
ncbi:lantibiotic immunity ABC transporter MutE/EpiE family permease subunit [Marinilactibacillus kalidii]|uniref:lantibiotic immunity ABC transporter MutE/EpiE family permease subunit n=1 Tax=Marinilactibacillus kalidii TaxID=2820274 RepID=UPI001ABE1AD1|nr:lantibiotic immunity ABC transporter MutE/EpiE family permease subunit [Marinilactibacillus kalidii]